MSRLKEQIADGSLLKLIEKFLKANVLDGLEGWTPTAGAPQGAVLSPLLSNVFLNPLDHWMANQGYQMVRYADDFVILCRTAKETQRALEVVQAWVTENGLTRHPTKTRIVDVSQAGFDFLGYHFHGPRRRVRDKSLGQLKESLRAKTRRTSGRSLKSVIVDLNRTLKGWFAYFQESQRMEDFAGIDRFVRQRLRAILKKRSHRRGCAKGDDFHRWRNLFLTNHGLYSLKSARELVRQSSWR